MIIEHIVEPKKLYLMWKDAKRKRHRVGELTPDKFCYLTDDADFKKAKKLGFHGYPAFPLDGDCYTNPVSAFIHRCQPRNRTGYSDYIRAFGLDPTNEAIRNISDFQLLAYTGAMVPLDPYNLVNPFEDIEPPFEFVLRMAGFWKHWKKVGRIDKNEPLTLNLKPKVQFDANTIEILYKDRTAGHIPKGYAISFRHWQKVGRMVQMKVFRVHIDTAHPYLYAFVSVVPALVASLSESRIPFPAAVE